MTFDMRAGFYFVAFVDLLGQREKLARFGGTAPKTDQEKLAFDEAMADTGDVIRNVRESVDRWLTAGKRPSDEALAKMAPERREEFARITTHEAFQTGFSDSFVVAFPLQVDGVDERLSRARAAYDLWSALLGLAVLSLESIAQGIPWRAGMDVGIGMNIQPNEVYGPVLLSAYSLESTVAEYPRAVLGRGLLDYLTYLKRLPADEPLDAFAARMAVGSNEFICTSSDGWPKLHIVSPAVLRAAPDLPQKKRLAHRWVREQVAFHWSRSDEKLFRRYSRLAHYFDAFPPALDPPAPNATS